MDRKKYIAKPNWKWLLTVPFAFVTVYNLARDEFVPNLPPLWNILSVIPWFLGLAILVIVVLLIVLEALWRFNRENQMAPKSTTKVMAKSEHQIGGQTMAQNAENIHNFFSPAEQTAPKPIAAPVFNFPTLPRVPTEKITMVRQPARAGIGNHEREFKFIINNDTVVGLRGCKVFLSEIARKKSKAKKTVWQVVNGLPSPKPLRWNYNFLDDFTLCEFGLDLDKGEKGSFTLADQDPSPRYPASGPTYFVYEPNYTYCDETISAGLEKGYDYRLRVAFNSKAVSPVSYHIFLVAHKDGCWDFENLARLTE